MLKIKSVDFEVESRVVMVITDVGKYYPKTAAEKVMNSQKA